MFPKSANWLNISIKMSELLDKSSIFTTFHNVNDRQMERSVDTMYVQTHDADIMKMDRPIEISKLDSHCCGFVKIILRFHKIKFALTLK